MKFIGVFILLIGLSDSSHAFDLEELLGCYRTLTNNSYPAQKSQHFIEHIVKEPSRYLFDLSKEPLPVLDFILGSRQLAIDAHHGDWVLQSIEQTDRRTLQINYDADVLVKRYKEFESSHVWQTLTIKKIAKHKFKINSDQAILYNGIKDRSQQQWKIKRISCPWGWEPNPLQQKHNPAKALFPWLQGA